MTNGSRERREGEEHGLEPGRFLADGTLVALATVVGGAVLFLANLYLARLFGPEQFGRFRVVISLFSFLAILIEWGAGPSLVKYISELGAEGARDLVRKVLALRAAAYLGLVAIVLLIRHELAERALQDRAQTLAIVGGAIFLLFLYFEVSKPIVLARRQIRLYAGSTVATFVISGALAVVFAPLGGVFGAVVGWGLGHLLGNLANVRYILRSGDLQPGPRLDVRRIFLRYGLPMQGEQAARNLEMAVVPFCALFFEPETVGALAFSMLFYRTVMVLAVSINSVLFPRFSRMAREPELARSSLRQAALVTTPFLALGALAVMPTAELLIAFVDPAYLSAAPVLRVLVVYALLSCYGAMLVSYYAGLGKVGKAVLVTSAQQIGLIAVSYLALRSWLA